MENTSIVINEAIPASSPTRSTTTSILVIDDDPEIRLLLQTAIEWQGYKAVLAENGAEGLAICSIQSDIAAIVCDMEMPVMDGLAFIEKIGRLKPKARVIMSTGGDEANLGHAKTFKVVRATLPKPCSIPDFWVMLERVLYGEA
jgi:CheY-like chemotaxis protein